MIERPDAHVSSVLLEIKISQHVMLKNIIRINMDQNKKGFS